MKKLGDNVRVVGGDTARHVEKYYKKHESKYTNVIDLSKCFDVSKVVFNSGILVHSKTTVYFLQIIFLFYQLGNIQVYLSHW